MTTTTQPSTPTQPAPSSSQPASSACPSTANTTAERNSKPASTSSSSPALKPDNTNTATLVLSDSSSDAEGASPAHSSRDGDTDMRDASPSTSSARRQEANANLKRKGTDASSSSAQPASKKAKATSSSKSATDGKKTKKGDDDDKVKGGAALVELKGSKFDFKQKPLLINVTRSYLNEMSAFIEYAVKHLLSSPDAKLDQYPKAHHSFIAKLVHESPNMLDGVFRTVKRTLVTAIAGGMSSFADSQDENAEEELDEAEIGKRIPSAPLKSLIAQLATRTNYGLALNDVDDLPEGVKDVPAALQIWTWEVKDDDMLPSEMRSKLERRRREREEVKTAAVALFHALSESEQAAVLSGDAKPGPSTSSSSSAATKTKSKDKGKAKAAADDSDADNEGDGADTGSGSGAAAKKAKGKGKEKEKIKADGEGEKGEGSGEVKPKSHKKKEKKEPTEEEKREGEEKARIKAEKEADKELKRQKKAEEDAKKLERKAEKDRAKAEKERVRLEKEEEEKRKIQAKKKQTNMFSSFFVKPTSSPAPEAAAGPADSPKSTKTKESDFDRVFHPFTIREKVTVAPVNAFLKADSAKVDVAIDSMPSLTLKDSLDEFLSTASPRRMPAYDPHPCPPVNVRQCVVAINDSTLTSSDTTVYYSLLEDRSKVRVKLFKFHSDVRPGYVGTWTKTSHVVGPRTPFARETALLNYAVDSDDEWEEEVDDPDAEDVGSDGGARSDEEGGAAGTGAESEADSWLAEDDEIEYEAGYDADGDIAMLDAEGRGIGGDDDDIIVIEGDKERRRRERDAKKKKVERERKKKEREAKRGPMLPVAKGLCWQHDVGMVEDTVFAPMRIQFLNDASTGLNPFTWVSKPSATPTASAGAATSSATASTSIKGKENVALASAPLAAASSSAIPPASTTKANSSAPNTTAGSDGAVNTLKAKRAPPKMPFPAEHLARFVRHVHGCTKSRAVVVELFVDQMKEEGVVINKNTVDAKFRDLGTKKVKGQLRVSTDVLAQAGVVVDE
ncbi:hypothetical protein JCM9279_001099 [Rhodotorula babjevae]